MLAEDPTEVLMPLRESLTTVNNEEDQYNEDPERRRLFCLGSIMDWIDMKIESICSDLKKIPGRYKETFHGKSGFGMDLGFNLFKDPTLIPESPQKKQIIKLLAEVKSIVDEKGFRNIAYLMTYREHCEIGSTAWNGFEKIDPNIPVGILCTKLKAEKRNYDGEALTFEEVDRARRLQDRTILDPATGRITQELDPIAANDSFHFVKDADRKAELVLREAAIVEELEQIVQWAVPEVKQGESLLDFFDAYSKGGIDTAQLTQACDAFNNRLDPKSRINFSERQKQLRQIAFEMGRYDDYLTPQEILIRVGGSIDPEYNEKPYTPLAIQNGTKTPEQVSVWRRKEGSMTIQTDILEEYCRGLGFCFDLEELDASGNTLKSPTFLDEDEQDGKKVKEDQEFREVFGQRLKVPFARPDDWFYKSDTIQTD